MSKIVKQRDNELPCEKCTVFFKILSLYYFYYYHSFFHRDKTVLSIIEVWNLLLLCLSFLISYCLKYKAQNWFNIITQVVPSFFFWLKDIFLPSQGERYVIGPKYNNFAQSIEVMYNFGYSIWFNLISIKNKSNR